MKVAIVAPSPVPFTRGGAERAVAGVQDAINDLTDHDAELVKVPVDERDLVGIVAGYRAFAELDLGHFDRVVSMKYPAWMVAHEHHTVLMFHPLRGLYDTYHLFGLPTFRHPDTREVGDVRKVMERGPDRRSLPEFFERFDHAVSVITAGHHDLVFPGPFAREVVHWLDSIALSPVEMTRHLALSWTVAGRPDYFPPGVSPGVVYLPGHLTPSPGGNERSGFFTASRLDGAKRIDLLIDAMAHVPGDTRLQIAGTGPLADDLAQQAAHDPRIELLGFIGDEDLAARYRGAIAVPFAPADEDLGLVTLEAFSQATPVVTCTDSGGPTELVADGLSGLVVPPEPAELGRALTRLATSPSWAAELGRAGQLRAARVTWTAAVNAILGLAETSAPTRSLRPPAADDAPAPARTAGRPPTTSLARAARRSRPKVVVTATFAIDEPRHGGQLRCRHLYGELAAELDVEIIALVDRGRPEGRTEIAPGLTQVAVARSAAHAEAGDDLSRRARMPVTDVVAGTHMWATPGYIDALATAARGAEAVILAEPYLLPAVDQAEIDLPIVYDAYNVEADLKTAALPDSSVGRTVLADVIAVEGRAVTESAAITACSTPDAKALAARYGRSLASFTVIPNGTDIPERIPTAAERTALGAQWRERFHRGRPGGVSPDHLAVFFGSWHPPNLDAVAVLVEAAERLPHVAFLSVGSHGDAFCETVVPANLIFPGVVTDRVKAKLLAAADVAVNPMRSGSGTNLKLIEYFAAGTPVVSTPFGARGVDVVDGDHLLFASPERFAHGIAAALVDPAAAARRAAAGRALAVHGYGWDALSRRLGVVIADIVDGRVRR